MIGTIRRNRHELLSQFWSKISDWFLNIWVDGWGDSGLFCTKKPPVERTHSDRYRWQHWKASYNPCLQQIKRRSWSFGPNVWHQHYTQTHLALAKMCLSMLYWRYYIQCICSVAYWQAERPAPTISQDARCSAELCGDELDEGGNISRIADLPAASPAVVLAGRRWSGHQCKAARLPSIARPVLILYA